MAKWEYTVLEYKNEDRTWLIKRLNRMGADRWECVSMGEGFPPEGAKATRSNTSFILIMKREVWKK